MIRRALYILLLLPLGAGLAKGDSLHLPVGEQLTYKIMWGFLPVGKTIISCNETLDQGTPCIRIRVEAKSNNLISTLYPVNDRIDCYIDPETRLPTRVEKLTVEGGFVCDDTLRFDRENLCAHWESRSASISTNYPIQSDTLDVGAFLYAMRSIPFTLNESKSFNIAVDGVLHGLNIKAKERKVLKCGSDKQKVSCTRFAVEPERSDLFVRKIPGDIWVTDDERRIMVKMKASVPVGHVSIVLDKIHRIEPPAQQALRAPQPAAPDLTTDT